MNPCHEAARRYLAMGLHPIPCAPRSKRPVVEWRQYQTDPPLADEIEAWWERWPEANVALVLGRGTFAVDLDGGTEAERLLFDRGILLPGAPRSQTANGCHVFLSAPTPVPDRVALLTTNGKKPQVDIRGVGIVVAPPSIHPAGPTYTWRIPLGLPFPEAPESLLTLIYEAAAGPRPASEAGASWITQALTGVGEGQRDVTCTRLAGYFLGLGMPGPTVEVLLLEGFARNCTPPLDAETVRKCVRSISRRMAVLPTEELRSRTQLRAVPIDEVLDEYEHARRQGPPRGLRTPFARLNRVLGGGFQPGELIYLGARPGVGKTALSLQVAKAVAEDGDAVLVVNREMVNVLLLRRMLAQTSEVSATAIKLDDLDLMQQSRVTLAIRQLRGLPIWFADDAISIRDITSLVTAWPGPPLGLVVVDYLQLVRAPADIRERRLQVEAVSQQLKTLAVQHRLPVLCLSSLVRPGRDVEGRRPTLADLRESGELEHDADIVIFLYRKMLERGTECIVAKNRDGGVAMIDFDFTAETVRFTESVG